LGSVIGLSARALEKTPGFPTYPDGFTTEQVSSGFIMPYTIHGVLGTSGSAGMLLLLFMAVTSTVSSSLIAVSSIISFDGYRTYLNPRATDRQIVTVSHLGVVGHGILITSVTLAMNYGGVNVTWLSYAMQIVTVPGIFPTLLTLLWSRQSKLAAIVSPIVGMATGITVWLVTVRAVSKDINVTTTAAQAPSTYFGPFFNSSVCYANT
jgi:Na+/proline symporter